MKVSGNPLALNKMMAFCAYQERCRLEVLQKLREFELGDEQIESIIEELERENYLNEERFAHAFAEGKFRIKKWGRIKIKMELSSRRISPGLISSALSGIDGDMYFETLKSIVLKKIKELKPEPPEMQKQKVVKFAYSRGFEPGLASEAFDEVNKNLSKEKF